MTSNYLVTGVSSGIGLDLCKKLIQRGQRVYGTCRKKSSSMSNQDQLSTVESESNNLLTVIEGIDVTSDDIFPKLESALKGVQLDYIIHNAGSANGGRDEVGNDWRGLQDFNQISFDAMRNSFEVNTIGVLRMQKALMNFSKSGTKIGIISSGLASIADNTSGGMYAYRPSKCAVNMVGKSLACDFKDRGISVALIAPGFIQTEFGGGLESMKERGAKPVGTASNGILKCLSDLTLDQTGKFFVVKVPVGVTDEEAMTTGVYIEEYPW